MAEEGIRAYCRLKGFHKQTEARWLGLGAGDGAALLALVQELKVGENHLKDFLDWLEEIALRDGVNVAAILARDEMSRIMSDPRLGRNDKLKRLKDELRRLRFPRMARIEEEIQRRIREMKLKPQILVVVPPGLESGAVTVQVKATNYDEMMRLVEDLMQLSKGEQMKEIFALLRGEAT
jgi:hypothetical protein